jgi:nanoRNase/pAp phosphatase (c-di-AMP/oligoRNAs hydrolase)
VLIVTHRRADLDAYSSTYLLETVLKEILGFHKIDVLIPNGLSTRITSAAEILKIKYVESHKELELDEDHVIIALDIGGESVVKDVMDILSNPTVNTKVLLDHHIHKESFLSNFTHVYIDSEVYSSTVEILLDLGLELNPSFLEMVEDEALPVIMASILVETRFILHAKPKSLHHLHMLSESSPQSISKAFGILQTEMDRSERIALLKGLQRIELYEADGYLIVLSHISAYQSTLASKLITLGADISVVYGVENDTFKMSVRLSNKAIDELGLNAVSDVVEPIIDKYGGNGGGHKGAAMYMARNVDKEVSEEIMRILEDVLGKRGLKVKKLSSA